MNLDATIEKYESKLAYYELLPDSYPSVAADVSQLIKWLKDYKRLLEAEKNWRKSLEDEIARKDEKIRSLKAELDKPISLCDSCKNNGCIFQSGIVRNHCDFYKAESEE